ATGGKIYAIGGTGELDINEEYNPATDGWLTKEPMPTGRTLLSAAVVGGKIYSVGGYNSGEGGYQNKNEEYDPGNDTWITRAPMPIARQKLAVAVAGGKIYALGGQGGDQKENEEYDPGVAQKFTGLCPNTSYYFKAKARNVAKTETGACVEVSTYTLAYSSGPAVFTDLSTNSVTLSWSSGTASIGYNKPGATYLVQTSPNSDFSVVANSSQTLNISATMSGSMNPNTLYYFRVRAANSVNVWATDYTVIGSTYTLAKKPGLPANPITEVNFSSVTVAWLALGNSDGTEYRVQASTTSGDYTGTLYGPSVGPNNWVTSVSTDIVSLTGCVTYYHRVQARSFALVETEFEILGSTKTTIYFDCGLRMFDGTQIISLTCGCQPIHCDAPVPPLRIGKDGVTYTVPLVDPGAGDASKMRIRDPDGNTKALKKY
ncbi:hypothetical protein KAR10_07765, partial [bacterium]|nr:hypothetical protein [bacterium]